VRAGFNNSILRIWGFFLDRCFCESDCDQVVRKYYSTFTQGIVLKRLPIARRVHISHYLLAALLGLAATVSVARPLPPPTDDGDLINAWNHYENGQLEAALADYRKAAMRGQVIGEFNLATMLLNGEGGPADPVQGMLWLRKAAHGGLAQAQLALGFIYENGVGLKSSQPIANQWFTLAAKQGDPDAELEIATQYFLGRGVRQDYAAAAHWYELAAQAGIQEAQYIIASCYEHGDGVPIDIERAIYWYQQAANNGDTVAAEKARVLGLPSNGGKPL
jgi:TPR repeat protein